MLRRLLLVWIAVHLAVWAPSVVAQSDAPAQRIVALVPAIENNLRQNVIPFWFPRSVDREHGGYRIHYGPAGEPLPGGTKAIVTQARTLWLASRLLRSDYAQEDFREAADAGFRFLRDRMWDAEHGGFFWEVDPSGTKVLRADKHLYGQAFGLYALSEYYLATGSAEAHSLANRLFALLESRAHDREYGGYREFFTRDWSAQPPKAIGYLGAPADLKLMNTHLHLLEALTTYVRAGAPPHARERLAELVAIESQAVIRRGWTASTDRHRRDWTPLLDDTATRASYGHDLENIWLVVDALRALDQPTGPYHDLFRTVFDYAVRHGYDENAGGFFESGPPGKPADRRAKVWWVQAEALVSALTMFELTRDPRYADVFARTWDFVDTKQTDWASGEWHEAVEPDGRPRAGNKAHPWKAGYHNGRALIEAVERIRLLTRAEPQASVQQALREALTFHASFDGKTEAAHAAGDAALYWAPTLKERQDAKAGLPPGGEVQHAPGAGRFGDALRFTKRKSPVVFFRGLRNMPYETSDWDGTVSFWLRVDPRAELETGFCDPVQITPRAWNDAAFFVEFEKRAESIPFRLGAYADLDVWNRAKRKFEDIPAEERPLITVADPPFSGNSWTHVVFTFERFNTKQADGIVTLYLNGERRGTLSAREQTFTWDPERAVIALGLGYIGLLDELSIFGRVLDAGEVRVLYGLESGVTALSR